VLGWTGLVALAMVSVACSSGTGEDVADAATAESGADTPVDGATLQVTADSVSTNVLAAELTVAGVEPVQIEVVATSGARSPRPVRMAPRSPPQRSRPARCPSSFPTTS